MSDRAWKARRLEATVRDDGTPGVLILGSSRVMQMNPDTVEAITGKRTFNLAVSGGNIVDCLALFRHAIRVGVKPKLVIMNVDEGMLVGGVTQANLRLASHFGLLGELPFPEKAEILLGAVKGIDLTSTARSLNALALLIGKSSPTPGERTLYQQNFVFLPNGFRINPRRVRAKQQGKFDLMTEIRMDLESATLQTYGKVRGNDRHPRPKFSPRMIDHLRTILSEAKSLGIEVRIVTTPEHPITAGTVVGYNRDHLHAELVAVLREQCERFGYTYKDFAELATFGGEPQEFWDSTHQTPRNLDRMTNAIFGIEPDRTIAPIPSEIDLLDRYGLY